MKTYLFLFITILLFNDTFGISTNAKCTIKLTNKDSLENFYLQVGKDFIYEDTVGIDNYTITYPLKEPTRAYGYINNDIDNIIIFYLHDGSFILNVDVANRKYSIENSILNNEKQILNHLEDSLKNKYHIPTYGVLRNAIISGINRDSFDLIYNKFDSIRSLIFLKYFQNTKTKSFLALEFIRTHINCSHNIIPIKKLKKLFNQLPATLFEYPTYKECKILFNKEFQNENENKNEKINKPLWNSK